jgi:hypothetical protein
VGATYAIYYRYESDSALDLAGPHKRHTDSLPRARNGTGENSAKRGLTKTYTLRNGTQGILITAFGVTTYISGPGGCEQRPGRREGKVLILGYGVTQGPITRS